MSISEPQQPLGGDIPAHLYISAIETPSQALVRTEYELLAERNRVLFQSFDVEHELGATNIELDTPYYEYEEEEPTLADAYRQRMLQDLGLTFEWLEDDDPAKVFQFKYRDGDIAQVRMFAREDGSEVPVYTLMGKDQDGNEIEHIKLLSYQVAANMVRALQDDIDEQGINQELMRDFQVGQTAVEQPTLSLDDKKELLASLKAFDALETAQADPAELDAIRAKLAKYMLPASGLLEVFRNRKLPEVEESYQEELVALAQKYELDAQGINDLYAAERSRRIEGLNKQLKLRRIARRAGTAAMGATVTSVASASAAFVGFIEGGTTASATGGAILGTVVGAWITAQEVLRRRRQERHVNDFTDVGNRRPYFSVKGQLADEQKLASTFTWMLGS